MRKFVIAMVAAGTLVVLGGGVAQANTTTKPPREKWVTYAVVSEPLTRALEEDMSDVATSAGAHDTIGVEDACSSLKSDLAVATGPLTHSPDRKLNRLLRTGLGYWDDAADSCLDGDYTTAGNELESGTPYVTRAADRVHEIAVRYGVTSAD